MTELNNKMVEHKEFSTTKDSLTLAALVVLELACSYIASRTYVNNMAQCEQELSPARIEYTLKPCEVDGPVYVPE